LAIQCFKSQKRNYIRGSYGELEWCSCHFLEQCMSAGHIKETSPAP